MKMEGGRLIIFAKERNRVAFGMALIQLENFSG